MKRFLFYAIILLTLGALSSCKCHRDTVVVSVNSTAELNADETWQLTQIRGKDAVPLEGQKAITLQINPEAGTFSGYSGCNRYFGIFKDLGEGTMELSGFNATKMACPEAFHKTEGAYMQQLRHCNGYNVGEYTLELTQNGNVLLTFEKVRTEK